MEIYDATMAIAADRYVTPTFYVPIGTRQLLLAIPLLDDDSVITAQIAPYRHQWNYPAYASADILAEFRMDDADGTTITSTGGVILAEAGDPTYQQAAGLGMGKGVAYDGTGDIHTLAAASLPSSLLMTTGNFTVEILTNLTSGSNASKTIMEQRGATDGLGWSLSTDVSEKFVVTMEDATGPVTAGADTDVATGAMVHLVAVFNRNAGSITPYINATAGTAGDATSNMGTILNAGALAIGGDSDSSGLITGSIFFVRIYNKALSAAEVTANYNVLIDGQGWPGWVPLMDPQDGDDLTICGSAKDPAVFDLSAYLPGLQGMSIRALCATPQTTTSAALPFKWIYG